MTERRPGEGEPEIITEPTERWDATDWWARWDRGGSRMGSRARGSAGRPFPWPGVFIVLLGVGLLVRQVDPRLSLTAVLLLALGFSFAAYWVVSRATWPLVPALLLLALAAGRLLGDLGIVQGDGPTALLLGATLLAVWAYGRTRGRGFGWALWLGAILVLIGAAQSSARVPGLPDLSALWPLVVVGVGVLLIAASGIRRDRA